MTMDSNIVKFPFIVSRRAHARKPRTSKNGNPEERGEKAATGSDAMKARVGDKPEVEAEARLTAKRDRRSLRGNPLRLKFAPISPAVTIVNDRVIFKLDNEYGVSAIALVYPNYPALRVARTECLDLITEAREFYERRAVIYGRLRTEYFPYFLDNHNQLLDAEIAAREARERLQVELTRARAHTSRLEKWNFRLAIFGALSGFIGIAGVVLSIFLWLWAKDDYCEAYRDHKYLGAICRLAPPPKPTPIEKPN
jgi:hypothetical protein